MYNPPPWSFFWTTARFPFFWFPASGYPKSERVTGKEILTDAQILFRDNIASQVRKVVFFSSRKYLSTDNYVGFTSFLCVP